MTTTPNMLILLPDVGVTVGPLWAQELNDGIEIIDSHRHVPGEGQAIPTAGIAINADLTFATFGITNLDRAALVNRSTNISSLTSVFAKSNELWYMDGLGNPVQITSNGAVQGSGGITGLVSPASAKYTPLTQTFSWLYDTGKFAKMDSADLEIYPYDGSTAYTNFVTVKAATGLATNPVVTLPSTTGKIGSDYGAVPIGAALPVFSGLAGVPSLPTSGTVLNGYMLCDGAVVPAGQTITTGTTLPNITSSVFIMGSTSSGTTGGANLQTTTVTVPDHRHSMIHTHAAFNDTSSVLGTSSIFGLATSNTTSTATTSGQAVLNVASDSVYSAGTNQRVSFQNVTVHSQQYYTSGVVDAPSGSGSTAKTGLMDTGTGATVGSWENRPSYISAVYVIRVV